MATQTQDVQEQVELENRARRVVLAALNNKSFMKQMVESYELEAKGATSTPLAKI